MRTGDEAEIRKSPGGSEHIWIVDRIKELIKVKVSMRSLYVGEVCGKLTSCSQGLQVAPAELEACLLDHPAVADCTVISVPDERSGEVPKAFVVKSNAVGLEESDAMVKRNIQKHVEKAKARHKWLAGGVEFVSLPGSRR